MLFRERMVLLSDRIVLLGGLIVLRERIVLLSERIVLIKVLLIKKACILFFCTRAENFPHLIKTIKSPTLERTSDSVVDGIFPVYVLHCRCYIGVPDTLVCTTHTQPVDLSCCAKILKCNQIPATMMMEKSLFFALKTQEETQARSQLMVCLVYILISIGHVLESRVAHSDNTAHAR